MENRLGLVQGTLRTLSREGSQAIGLEIRRGRNHQRTVMDSLLQRADSSDQRTSAADCPNPLYY